MADPSASTPVEGAGSLCCVNIFRFRRLKYLDNCCASALSASISFDHAILGPGPKPASLADRSVFTRGADLRDYGVRRAPMYRTLCAEALRLACEVGILLEPSEDNAASCFLLQFFENGKLPKHSVVDGFESYL